MGAPPCKHKELGPGQTGFALLRDPTSVAPCTLEPQPGVLNVYRFGRFMAGSSLPAKEKLEPKQAASHLKGRSEAEEARSALTRREQRLDRPSRRPLDI